VNEDSMTVFETADMKVFVVCDGMGGHAGGQEASQTAVATIRDFLTNHLLIDPREAIHNAIISANEAILNRSRRQPELAGMGSTCEILMIAPDGKIYYGHVGDSRIYIVANHRVIRLTKDHSFVQTLIDAGTITEEQAGHHPRRNEITNALGLPHMRPPDVGGPIEPEAGNCFLLCSDGLTGMVDDAHIEHIVSKHQVDIQKRAERLVQMANEAGGTDNITVQLIEFAISAQDIAHPEKKKNRRKKVLLVLLLVLLLAGGTAGWWFLWKQPKPAPEPPSPDTEIICQSSTPETCITSPVAFAGVGTEFTVAIDFPEEDDAILPDSAMNIADTTMVEKVGISGKFITLKWLREVDGKDDTVRIDCQTKRIKYFAIKIPLTKTGEQSKKQPAGSSIFKEDTIDVTLDSIFYEPNVQRKIPLSKKFVSLTTGQKETNDSTVKCDVTSDKNIVIEFRPQDGENYQIPDSVVFFERIKKRQYRFIIPVEKPQEKTSPSTFV
jgi:serine/threonine protein phosphatase PrpC